MKEQAVDTSCAETLDVGTTPSEASMNMPIAMPSSCTTATVQLPSSSVSQPTYTLQDLHNSLKLPSRSWCDQSPQPLTCIKVCKLTSHASSSRQPLVITHCLTVNSDMTFSLFVHNCEVKQNSCSALASIPVELNLDSFATLLSLVDRLRVCAGHPDANYVAMATSRKGVFKSQDGSATATLDNYAPVKLNGEIFAQTVRTVACEMLVAEAKCVSCATYRATLRKLYSRWSVPRADEISDPSSHANERYLNTPEKKAKLDKMKKRAQAAEREVRTLQQKVEQLTEEHGESIDSDLHDDLLGIMHEKTEEIQQAYPEGSFGRLFWEEQLRAATAKDPRQVRWHPVMIRWCLNLKLLSSAAYHAMRSAGFIKLPSERTLRDYTHYFKSQPGFQREVIEELIREAKLDTLPEEQRYCGLIVDEMKVKESLVYDKYTGGVTGFTNVGKINDDLLQLERDCQAETGPAPVATHLLVLMVRGLLFKLNFPFAHFATTGVTADLLFPIVWESIRLLESIGLKVMCITADGASSNRKFFRMHRGPDDASPTYKTRNPFAQEERFIYFICDPPHLIKTSRNCWSHSGWNGTRHMTVSAVHIATCFYNSSI